MQVVALSTPARTGWTWRIVNAAGEVIEESRERFPTIATAVATGRASKLGEGAAMTSITRPPLVR